jgi:ubiquinone/menaquinone biosynthesis C-methylase UbiE
MALRVCPWYIGYFLASPVRRLWQNPRRILQPFVREGMTVLEPGPGMGFFTLDLARMVGPSGRVVAVDVQPRMLDGLARRARRAGLDDRVEGRLAPGASLGLDELAGQFDFALAFAMIHELPDTVRFIRELHASLKPGAQVLVAEPRGHVTQEAFTAMLALAAGEGFRADLGPAIRSSLTAVLTKA